MIMVDREDFEGLGFPESLFHRIWIPDEPEAIACDYADVPAPGPFLIQANDEAVWFSHGQGDWMQICRNPRHEGPDQRRWSHMTTLYAEAAGLSLQSLLGRLRSIRRQLRGTMDKWVPWDEVYHWDDGSDIVWAGLTRHPWLKVREDNGVREVRYVSRR